MRSYAELFSGKKDEIMPELGGREAYLFNDLMEEDQFCRSKQEPQADAAHAAQMKQLTAEGVKI
jgi:hypothetical protein